MDKKSNSTPNEAIKNTDGLDATIGILNGQVFIKTMRIMMSRSMVFILSLDLICIFFGIALLVHDIYEKASVEQFVAAATIIICGGGKLVCDFINWMATVNHSLDKMGSYYIRDLGLLCHDFATGAIKLCDEAVKRVKPNAETEGDGGTSNSSMSDGV